MNLRGIKAKLITKTSCNILWVLIRYLCRFRIENIQNLPKPPYILVANHASYLDWAVLFALYKKKMDHDIIFIGKKRLFNHKLFKYYMEYGQTICVDENKVDKSFFVKTKSIFKNRQALGIFPEGRRSVDGNLLEANQGAINLALMNKVPIVPVGIIGFFELLPPNKKVPRICKTKIKIGEAIYYSESDISSRKDKLVIERLTREMMTSIGTLINKEYGY